MTSGTLEQWLASQDASADITETLHAIAAAGMEIAEAVHHAPLRGHLGESAETNVQGEVQKDLDIICNDIMIGHLSKIPHLSAFVSEEVDHPIPNPTASGNLVCCFDPLDGSSNVDTNGTIGTIFSILDTDGSGTADSICAAAHNMVAGGYILYGPATIMVLTTGKSVAKFAGENGRFMLVKSDLCIPAHTHEFAINMSYRERWDDQTRTYIENCVLGEAGPRGKPFNMRWMGAMVADIHRIFMRGGIFLYPALATPDGPKGKLRLLYEILPLGWMMEVAGGRAICSEGDLHAITVTDIHQRAPFIAGSVEEAETFLQ